MSAMVIMVLLKEAFTWATPEVMFLRSLRLTRVVSVFAIQVLLGIGAAVMPAAPPRMKRIRILALSLRSSQNSIRRIQFKLPARSCRPELLLLAGDRLCRTLAGASIGVGALT